MNEDEYTYTTTRTICFMYYIKNESAEEVANKYIPILEKTFPEYSGFEYVKQSDWLVVIYPEDHTVERRAVCTWYWNEDDISVIDTLYIYDDETESIEQRFYDTMNQYGAECEVQFDYEDNVVNVINDIKNYIIKEYGG